MSSPKIPRKRIDALIAEQGDRQRRVFRVMAGNRAVWVKYGEKNYRNWGQRLLGQIASLPLRRMSLARQRVYTEVTRLRALRRAGFNVPEVVAIGPDYVALDDMGETLDSILRADTASERVRGLVSQAATLLAQLHTVGQWHGAARVRNFVVLDGAMGMIDFEDPVSGLPHLYNRVMDLFMLTLSLTRRAPEGKLTLLALEAYGRLRSPWDFRIAGLLLLPVYLLLRPMLPWLGEDGWQITMCLGTLYADALTGWFGWLIGRPLGD
ncbi:lipopolysaccharide kinase InaA family protein [Ancylobacter sp. MQZ15Z-1]|uniref:Lipopolysaccharide kinase InaA family protein n=1 Tax=Ancylobacter mangrovi TaxID=2972472 RepID=A0A9X2T4P0_9HYPH|nr:lipopolysaccharide kinase InaA family protein [Ancylobacter mangrovi]MCS0496326.1 lipopolysaccharide kinase InaA family protein [Ancylobacter mangrovi]